MKPFALVVVATATALVFGALAHSPPAAASEKPKATITATLSPDGGPPLDGGVRGYIAGMGSNLAVQCPGYQVSYKSATPTDFDGGVASDCVLLDFTTSPMPPPYRIPLRPNEDRVYFRNVDAGVFGCGLFTVSP